MRSMLRIAALFMVAGCMCGCTSPQITSLTCAAQAVEEGAQTVCTVTLQVPAPTGGATVDLSFLGFIGPATITIPSGKTVGQFVVEAEK